MADKAYMTHMKKDETLNYTFELAKYNLINFFFFFFYFRLRLEGDKIFKSKYMLLIVVILCILDCALVLGELTLDLHKVKGT